MKLMLAAGDSTLEECLPSQLVKFALETPHFVDDPDYPSVGELGFPSQSEEVPVQSVPELIL